MKIKSIIMVFAIVAGFTAGALAQDYPTKPAKVIVPFTAGSATDTIARAVCKKLSEMWGQPVEVENLAGAGGTTGTDAVAKSAPDGYTLLMNSNAFATNTALYATLPYDSRKDFVYIAPLTKQPYVLVVAASSGIKNTGELISAARAKPGQMKFGSAGMGSSTHFAAEKFKLATGIEAIHVPYKGGPEATAATIDGTATFWFPPMAFAVKNLKDGKLVALGVTGAGRSASLPDVPTIAESGAAGFEDTSWMGLWAPAGIPATVVDKLAKDVARALASQDLREQFTKLGAEPMSMTPAEFSNFVQSEIDIAAKIVKTAGIKQL